MYEHEYQIIIIFPTRVVYDKKSQLRKYGYIDLVVAQADMVHKQHQDPPQSDYTTVVMIAASTNDILVYVLQKHSLVPGTTAAACCCII